MRVKLRRALSDPLLLAATHHFFHNFQALVSLLIILKEATIRVALSELLLLKGFLGCRGVATPPLTASQSMVIIDATIVVTSIILVPAVWRCISTNLCAHGFRTEPRL